MTGKDVVLAYMEQMPPKLVSRVRDSVGVQTLKLSRRVLGKLNGGVLKSRSGALASAISQGTFVREGQGRITGEVGLRGASKEVAISGAAQEFGATIQAHVLSAKQAAALKFQINGADHFARAVMIPTFQIPEHSFLRSAFRELRSEMVSEISKAADLEDVTL